MSRVCWEVIGARLNPSPADQNYCRFLFVYFVVQITDSGNKMCV